jgi:predicted small lipoprotein YifL
MKPAFHCHPRESGEPSKKMIILRRTALRMDSRLHGNDTTVACGLRLFAMTLIGLCLLSACGLKGNLQMPGGKQAKQNAQAAGPNVPPPAPVTPAPVPAPTPAPGT